MRQLYFFTGLLVVLPCSGCGDDSQISINSSANVTDADADGVDVINAMLSDIPPSIHKGDLMRMNIGLSTAFPDAPLIYLFSALKRDAAITRFQINWKMQLGSQSTRGIATYNRKTRMLWCCLKGLSKTEYFVFSDVTPPMLLHAATDSIRKAEGRAWESLPRYGCKRIS